VHYNNTQKNSRDAPYLAHRVVYKGGRRPRRKTGNGRRSTVDNTYSDGRRAVAKFFKFRFGENFHREVPLFLDIYNTLQNIPRKTSELKMSSIRGIRAAVLIQYRLLTDRTNKTTESHMANS